MKAPLAALCLAALAGGFFMPAHAQPMACDDRAKVLAHLESKYDERVVALGMTSKGALREVLASPGGATWTIIETGPDGIACLKSAGEHWTRKPMPEPGEGT